MSTALFVDGNFWRSVGGLSRWGQLFGCPRDLGYVFIADIDDKESIIVKLVLCPLKKTYPSDAKARKIVKEAAKHGCTYWRCGGFFGPR